MYLLMCLAFPVAVVTNIEGREWQERGRRPEHPRASSTDDAFSA